VINDNAAERDQPEGLTIPTDVPIVGGLNLQDTQGWFGEQTLDVVSADQAQIISNSYGSTSDSQDKTSDGYWEQGAAQGIGVYFSSGDSGNQTAGGTDAASRSVDGGANSPYVTAVGGTTLAIGRTTNYEFETYWGTNSATLTNGAWGTSSFNSAGEGGTSEVYGEPYYQTAAVPGRFANYWQPQRQRDQLADDPRTRRPRRGDAGGGPNSGFLMGQTEDFSAYANLKPLAHDTTARLFSPSCSVI
jgi:hypothetical protein